MRGSPRREGRDTTLPDYARAQRLRVGSRRGLEDDDLLRRLHVAGGPAKRAAVVIRP
jgi:hypothetical protein